VEQRPLRSKERQVGSGLDPSDRPADEQSLGAVFDRAWARALLREAAARQRREAEHKGEAAVERIELLRLRFEDGLPIREIARRWSTDASRLHHVYATARKEFLRCLEGVVRYHHPGATSDEAEQECRRLLELTV
ncbi:MAG: sigma-70 family RNA polymerase sigma factor, partial [Planctomycetota bacterium]